MQILILIEVRYSFAKVVIFLKTGAYRQSNIPANIQFNLV